MATFNLKALVRPNVSRLTPYSSARDEYTAAGTSMIFLDANENPNETGVNRYPDPQQRHLKLELAQQKGLAIDQILIGNGSDEVLDLIFRAFCEPAQDEIICMPPTYGMYKVLAGINNVQCIEVQLSATFELRAPEILAEVKAQTKLVFICSPNNPTGTMFKQDDIERLLTEFKGLVIIDEAYIDFAEAKSWISRLDEYPNLIVTQTLSKAYGLAGIRLGIAYASKEIISVLNKIKPPYNVNVLSQKMALEVIKNPELIKREIQEIKRQKVRLIKALQEVDFVQEIYPSSANFILVKVDNANQRYAEILREGIVIRNRTNQALCENTLRLTVGTETETSRLINVLKQLS